MRIPDGPVPAEAVTSLQALPLMSSACKSAVAPAAVRLFKSNEQTKIRSKSISKDKSFKKREKRKNRNEKKKEKIY